MSDGKHDIQALSLSIDGLARSIKQLYLVKDFEELKELIRQPYWTTPAEFHLVQGAVTALQAQVEAALALKQVVMDAARQIGR